MTDKSNCRGDRSLCCHIISFKHIIITQASNQAKQAISLLFFTLLLSGLPFCLLPDLLFAFRCKYRSICLCQTQTKQNKTKSGEMTAVSTTLPLLCYSLFSFLVSSSSYMDASCIFELFFYVSSCTLSFSLCPSPSQRPYCTFPLSFLFSSLFPYFPSPISLLLFPFSYFPSPISLLLFPFSYFPSPTSLPLLPFPYFPSPSFPLSLFRPLSSLHPYLLLYPSPSLPLSFLHLSLLPLPHICDLFIILINVNRKNKVH
jgi:hypothetical protein